MGGLVRGVLMAAALLAALAAEAAAQGRGLTLKIKASTAADAPIAGEVQLYKASYALVIGIDDYTGGWPRLSNAVKDAELVAQALTRRGFAVTLKRDLGSADLKRSLEEFFAIRGEDPDARLFVWFAGHGYTEYGEGYIVPADAPRPEAGGRFRLSALSLRRFGDLVRLARSKHAMTVFDACFAGTVFTTQRALPPAAVTRATTLPVRQFVASGDAGQTVSDDGTFRKLFLRALDGEERADANADGYLTGTELGLWLTDRLTNLTNGRQTPRYGKLRDADWDRGDFVFALAAPPPPRTSTPAAPTPPTGMTADIVFWQSIQSSTNPAVFEEFLKQFPSSPFAGLARLKLKELKGTEVAVVVPPKAAFEVDELDGAFVVIRTANIRREPSAKSQRVGRLAADDPVNVTGKVKERDWYRVEYQGKTGFVFAPLLAALAPLSPTPAMEPPPTTARRAIFVDAASGRVLFEKAADETFEPGSIAQLMTLYLLFERLRDGTISLEETFPVSETAWRMGGARRGGSTMFLEPGSWVGVEDLLRGIVVSSGTDASIAVAEALSGSEAAFVREMEQRAKSLGLSKSRFKNSSGWPAPGQKTSARDAARLARRLI